MHPEDYSKFVDFIPIIGLQAKIDPHLELCDIEFRMSKQESKKIIEVEDTEFLNGSGKYTSTGHYKYKMKDDNAFGEVPITQRELDEDIKDNLGVEFVDAIIEKRTIIKPIQSMLYDITELDGFDYVIVEQVKKGNHVKRIKEVTGIPLTDPREEMRKKLINEGLIYFENQHLLLKLRSNQVSKRIYLDSADDVLSSKNANYLVSKELADTWCKDAATLTSLWSYHNLREYKGTVYRLDKMGVDTVL